VFFATSAQISQAQETALGFYLNCETSMRLNTPQGYRVWKFEREEGERSVNFWALSLRSWSGFDVFRPLRDETDPNAIPLQYTMEQGSSFLM
jgi:hypothetical protein